MSPNYAVGVTHDAKIGSYFVRFVLGTHRKVPGPDLAPRYSVGVGGEIDETFLRHATQKDFSSGCGQMQKEDPRKYWEGDKIWSPGDHRKAHLTTLGAFQLSNVVGGGAVIDIEKGPIGGDFWVAIDNKVYKLIEETMALTLLKGDFLGNIVDMQPGTGPTDQNLWVTVKNDGIWRMIYDTGVWNKQSADGFWVMHTPWQNKMWSSASQELMGEKNKIYSYEGGTGPTFQTQIGRWGWGINGMIEAMNKLWIGKEEGLYYYDGLTPGGVPFLINFERRDSNCGKRMRFHNGYLYWGWLKRVYRTNGGSIEALDYQFPDVIKSITTWGDNVLVSSGNRLFQIVGRSVKPLYNEITVGEAYESISDAGGGQLRKMFEGLGTTSALLGYVVQSKEDGQFPNRDKAWVNVRVTHEPLVTASGHKIRVYYSLLDGVNMPTSWTLLGTSEANGATEAVLSFPVGTKSKVVVLKITLESNANVIGPLLKMISLGYMIGGNAKKMWAGVIDCSDRIRLLNEEEVVEGGAELSTYLWGLNDSLDQVTYVDEDGSTRTVIVRCLGENKPRNEPGRAERYLQVQLVEV